MFDAVQGNPRPSSSSEGTELKSVFEYDDYRAFLRDYYHHAKAQYSYFSFRYFARVAGFETSNFLKLVMDGKSNLSKKSIEKFIRGLRLNKEEGDFFRNLVLFNQAKSQREKEDLGKALLRSKTYRKLYPLRESQFNYYRYWYFVAIRELVGTEGFQEDPRWVAQNVCPAITPEQAKKALEELLRLGFLQRDPTGRLRPAHAAVVTDDEVSSSSISLFHKEMMKLAAESIHRIPRERREISSLTTGISLETAAKVKEMIQEFRKNLIGVLAQSERSEVVYQLNFQFFPLSLTTESEKK